MPLPGTWNTVNLIWTGSNIDGSTPQGTIEVQSSVLRFFVEDPTPTLVLGELPIVTHLASGTCTIPVPATDDPAVVPNGFTYRVVEKIVGRLDREYFIEVPMASAPSIDLAAVAPVSESLGQPVSLVTFASLDAVATDVVNLSGDVVDVTSAVAVHETRLDALDTTVSSAVTEVDNAVDAVNEALADVSVVTADMLTLESVVGGFDGRIDTVEGLATTFDSRLDALEPTVAALNATYAKKAWFYPEDYGAVGNGTTNDTTAFQAAIDAVTAAGGGVLALKNKVYVVGGIQIKSGVLITKHAGGVKWAGGPSAAVLKSPAGYTGWVVDSPATAIQAAGIIGINVDCNATAVGQHRGGIRIQNGTWVTIDSCSVSASTLGAISISGTANIVQHCGLQTFWQYRTSAPTVDEGVLRVQGTDALIAWNQCNGGMALTDTVGVNTYKNAVYATTLTSWFIGGNGEFSECAWKIDGSQNTFIGIRGDTNPGAGLKVLAAAYGNMFQNCIFLANSLSVNAAYSHVECAGFQNTFQSTHFGPDWTGSGNRVKWGFSDTMSIAGFSPHALDQYLNKYDGVDGPEGIYAWDAANSAAGLSFSFRKGGAGDVSVRPAARFATGQLWFGNDGNGVTFSDGTYWRGINADIQGNLFPARYAAHTQHENGWDPYIATCTVALVNGGVGWARNNIQEITTNAAGVTNTKAEVTLTASAAAPVAISTAYKFALEAKGTPAKTNTIKADIWWFTAAFAFISADVLVAAATSITNSTTGAPTQIVSGTVTSPGTAAFALIHVELKNTTLANGDKFYLAAPTCSRNTFITGTLET